MFIVPDVSTFQKNTDIAILKQDGCKGIICRSSYGREYDQVDAEWLKNADNCIKNQMPLAVYHYSYAKTVDETLVEANVCYNTIKNINNICWISFDLEDRSQVSVGKETLTNMAIAFLDFFKAKGYKTKLYTNPNWMKNYVDTEQVKAHGHGVWIAWYRGIDPSTFDYSGSCDIWQYTSSGTIAGVNGRADMNACYLESDFNRIPYYNNGSVPISPIPSSPTQSSTVSQSQINTNKHVDVTYRVRANGNWYSEIVNSNNSNSIGYAGSIAKPITDVAIKVSDGSVKYRVHLLSGRWLNWITDYNLNNGLTGYAGNGTPIDAIEVYFYTPSSIRPYKKARYRVSPINRDYYSYQYDDETTNSQDGYAGCFGNKIDRLQIDIV